MTSSDTLLLRSFPVADFASLDPSRALWFSSVLSDMAPVVVNRGNGRAFYDVCAHRKAAILNGASQDKARLRCPYHGWTFGDNGNCPNGALKPVDRVSLGGLSLLTADAARLDANEMEDIITVFNQYSWSQIKPLARRTYSVRSHWSYWVENFLECYHCSFNHPQLCIVEDHISASSSKNFAALGELYNAAGCELAAIGAHRPLIGQPPIYGPVLS